MIATFGKTETATESLARQWDILHCRVATQLDTQLDPFACGLIFDLQRSPDDDADRTTQEHQGVRSHPRPCGADLRADACRSRRRRRQDREARLRRRHARIRAALYAGN